MATYKVLQDIEAEDKLLGPFTLKQFIFMAITLFLGFIGFNIVASSAPIFMKVPLSVIVLLPMLVFGFLAAPISRDQPNDIWLLARLRFLFKPRVRIWNQDGIQELVTVTVPKVDVHVFTDNLSQTEVKSRLGALASTLDSRGWAVKNVNANLASTPGYLTGQTGSDRLVGPSQLPQEVSAIEVLASDDILDPTSNSTAQNLDRLIQQSTSQQKQQAISSMTQASSGTPPTAPRQDYWFMNQAAAPAAPLPQNYATFDGQTVVAPGTDDAHDAAEATDEEKALAHKLVEEKQHQNDHVVDHMKVLEPLHDREGKIVPRPPAAPPVASQPAAPAQTPPVAKPAVQALARNNDLNIATLARQAKKLDAPEDGEVVISLH